MALPIFGVSQAIENRIYRSDVKTLLGYPAGNPLGDPFIAFRSGETIAFHFDVIDGDIESIRYSAIHCDRNWEPSEIESNEVIQGFSSDQINDIESSFGTLVNYMHYHFDFPNDMMQPRLSGNYAIVAYLGNEVSDRDAWLWSSRVVVYEESVAVGASVLPGSIIADRMKQQEVDVRIQHSGFQIYDPMKEVSVSILQNGFWTHQVSGLKPIFIQSESLNFDYNAGENCFDAGSEWRHFDLKDFRYVSDRLEKIQQEPDGYHAYLRHDVPEGKRAYASQQDINGKALVMNDLGDDPNLEADYYYVHFYLDMPFLSDQEPWIESLPWQYDEHAVQCEYDDGMGYYHATLFIKQGYYNYRYVMRDKYADGVSLRATEGSYQVTEN
ncbi:MAG: DUF5103 domain-containing protein, partial [Flavobacteriales bacterium]